MNYIFRSDLFPTWRGNLAWRERLHAVSEALLQHTPGLASAVDAAPYHAFEACAGASGPYGDYRRVPPEALSLLGRVTAELRAPYLCGLLLWNMERFELRFRSSGLDPALAPHFVDAFHRLLDQISSDPSFARLESDAFQKDLWIARGVMIPAFAQVWWPYSGLGKRALLRAGLPAAAFVLGECRGLSPFFEGHTHDPVAKVYWNPDGWVEALRIAAVALPAFPGHRGAFGTAWFYDPAMKAVSPRLGYVADLQVGHGAHRFRVGTGAGAVRDALATSPTRRSLHAEGRYLPTDYTVVWSRDGLETAYGRRYRDSRMPKLAQPQLAVASSA